MVITIMMVGTTTQYPLVEISPITSATVTQTEKSQGQEKRKRMGVALWEALRLEQQKG